MNESLGIIFPSAPPGYEDTRVASFYAGPAHVVRAIAFALSRNADAQAQLEALRTSGANWRVAVSWRGEAGQDQASVSGNQTHDVVRVRTDEGIRGSRTLGSFSQLEFFVGETGMATLVSLAGSLPHTERGTSVASADPDPAWGPVFENLNQRFTPRELADQIAGDESPEWVVVVGGAIGMASVGRYIEGSRPDELTIEVTSPPDPLGTDSYRSMPTQS